MDSLPLQFFLSLGKYFEKSSLLLTMSFRRKAFFNQDVCEWLQSHLSQISLIRKNRYALDRGLVGAITDFFPSKTSGKVERKEEDITSKGNVAMGQYYESEELLKRMKWKRVTWDEDADYQSFSTRLLTNDDMFKNVKSFSFMSVHIVKDPLTANLGKIKLLGKSVSPGDITSLFLRERDCAAVDPYQITGVNSRLNPFSVDWISGTVHILDTTSPQEVLTFLQTIAQRLQALQIKMEEQQERIMRDIKRVNVRVGATIRYNEFNTSFWDDPKRLTDINYINPDDLEHFLNGILKSPLLFRWFLRGTEIKVLSPGNQYYANTSLNVVEIPSNFSDFNWLKAHSRFQTIEQFIERFRRFWWFWFAAGLVLVGDVELL